MSDLGAFDVPTPTAADVSGLFRALAPVSTFDLDSVPERSDENLARLLRALLSLQALHRDLAGRAPEMA